MSEIKMAVMDAQDNNFLEPSPDKGARFVNFSACGSGRVGEKESVVEPTWIPKFLGMQATGIYLEDSYLKYCIQEENAKNTPSGRNAAWRNRFQQAAFNIHLDRVFLAPPYSSLNVFERMPINNLSTSQGPISGLCDAFISQERGRE